MMKVRILTVALSLSMGLLACGDDSGGTPAQDTGPTQKDSGFVSFDAEVDSGVAEDSGVVDTGVDGGEVVDCSGNPSGCAAFQRIGAPPSCLCLPDCEPGYSWNGTSCDADPVDGGVTDSGLTDSGTVTTDAGLSDTGIADTGVDPDGGIADTGIADTGIADTGIADTGIADTGIVDSGTPDAGFGIGFDEGDGCNPLVANECLQQPGLVCQDLDPTNPANTTGICLKACDRATNGANQSNLACDGIGQACVDFFELGDANSRCMNVAGPFAEIDGTVDLQVCDPTPGNLQYISVDPAGISGICWPLCTTTLSTADPVQVNCDTNGPYTSCNDEFTFPDRDTQLDPDANFFGLCNQLSTRDAPCGFDRGRQCAAGDVCVLGICRQELGTTCTGAPACASLGQVCLENDGFAHCHQPCGVFAQTGCPTGQSCTVATTGVGGLTGVAETCGLASANLPAGGDCSDVLGFGTNSFDCGAGGLCLQVPTALCTVDDDCVSGQSCVFDANLGINYCIGFGVAECADYCDPNLNPTTCTAPAQCFDFGTVPPGAENYGACG